MPSPLLARKKAVVAVIETTYGESPAIETGTLMLATELTPTPYQGNTVERTRMREHLGGYAQINTGPNTQLQITVPWSGSGTAPEAGVSVTAPAIGTLLRACKLREVQDLEAGEVVYEPISGDGESVTLYYLHDGQLQRIRGARGTLTGSGQTGGLPTLSFTFTGLYERPATASPISLTVQNQADEIPVNFQNTTTFSLQGYDCIGRSFSFDLGNTVSPLNLVNYEGVLITDRAATGQVTFQAPRIAEFDVFQKVESHQVVATGPILFEHGTVPGNIVGWRSVKSQLTGMAEQESDGGITNYQMDGRHIPVDGDDELALYFK